MAKHKKDAAALGREAIDCLALLYHHSHGVHEREFIKSISTKVPDWRKTVTSPQRVLPEETRVALQHALAWDRAIKLLVAAGRLE